MSQNQSYFWHTTRRNVYLKRSAKLQMLLALLAVLTFSTICIAEVLPSMDESNNDLSMGAKVALNDAKIMGTEMPNDIANNDLPNNDPTKGSTINTKTGFVDAFTASISVILFTELGDKTFFIAAIMAMRHPRLIVFIGAISALALMTVLSVVFGMAATIIPKVYTYYISTALFAIFGLKMIYEGYFMKPTDAQEELEEVQSEMRKREDELMRSKRGKYEDNGGNDGKRKNSNSDKEDDDSGAGAAGTSSQGISKLQSTAAVKNPEMQHRHRKQININSNINNSGSNNNINGCELNKLNNDDYEDEDSIGACRETDVFLENGLRKHEAIKMSTTNYHHHHHQHHHNATMNNSQSSPAISSISNQTTQTHCDDEFLDKNLSPNKRNFNKNNNNNNNNNISTNDNNDTPNGMLLKKQRNNKNHQIINGNANVPSQMTMIHSASANANLMTNMGSKHNSINSIAASNHSINSAATAGSVGLDGGSSKRRLERNVSATVVQDPESGVVRKAAKKGAAYLTTRVLMQAFTMTFLAEWGDRSQLTTIILAASKNVYGVITGGIIGHSICTGLAVIGGRMVAAKISVRTVTIVGGIVFLCFAVYALIVGPDDI